jgi:hypothetical protein
MKLSKNEFKAFLDLLEQVFLKDPETVPEALQTAVLAELYRQNIKRFFDDKKTYRVTLSPAQALAFWSRFSNSRQTVYEGALINMICGEVHKKYLTWLK